MNAMKMPGFTAETSLFANIGGHLALVAGGSRNDHLAV